MSSPQSSRGGRLVSNIAVYAVGTFSSQLVGFLTLPLITQALTTAEFGIADIIVSILALAIPLVSLGISEAVLRFGMEPQHSPARAFRRGTLVAALGFLCSLTLLPLIMINPDFGPYAPWLYSLLGVGILRDIAFQLLRSQNSIRTLMVGGVLQAALFAAALVVFVVIRGQGVAGYLAALLVSSGAAALLYLVQCWIVLRGTPRTTARDSHLTRQMLSYCLPLMPNGVLWWVVATSSKLVLLGVSSAAAVGLYAVASRLVSVLAVGTQVILQGWQISAIQEKDSATRDEFRSEVFAAITASLIVGASILVALVKPITAVLVSAEFYASWQVVPPLLFGLIFLSMATFIGAEYRVQMATGGALRSSLWGAATALGLSFPGALFMGPVGAALAATAGYLALLGVRLRDFGLPSPTSRYPLVLSSSLLVLLLQSAAQYLGLPPPIAYGAQLVAVVFLIATNTRFLLRVGSRMWQSRREARKPLVRPG